MSTCLGVGRVSQGDLRFSSSSWEESKVGGRGGGVSRVQRVNDEPVDQALVPPEAVDALRRHGAGQGFSLPALVLLLHAP